ncbi:iron complex transport system substrate-binding protein [Natronincola peptidivorans]|uniref:Iron complex transport system substrate-binding protein n=1 Tax=Natronincola peptidivorans TaxID=426128 RepID=A0A1I0DJQ2_9FIRM|nr:cobalamin-binding protein [Natronincola peptidivorans]SET32572.1 iron complex transport system substrate-binding protein [Natronincola peptidivorans]
MKHKIQVIIALVLLLTFMVTGCAVENPVVEEPVAVQEDGVNDFPREVTDGLGNKVVIEKQPEKIISAVPSHTEILFALGLEDKIIGVSEFCDYPIEALEKEEIGGYKTLNIEKIIELSPDIILVYGNGDEEAIAQIKASGITIARYEPESIEDILEAILSIGEITGMEMEAKAIVNELTERRDEVLAKVKTVDTVKVFYEIWHEPLMAAGPGSFMDELILLAGGENIAGDAEGAYPIFSIEALVERNPEVYLMPADHVVDFYNMTEEEKLEKINQVTIRPGYTEISAVKNNRIELLEPNIVSRPGVRIIEALESVARAIHPELF